ncbi:MAG: NapC/NirT family cytochrome c [Dehalococcoidia bacterium]|nr:NapC/NirT family cytochrome c [Dehalococcoidia bacterium]
MKNAKWFKAQYATIDLKDVRQRRRLRFFLIGGAVELIVLALIGFRGMEFMDSPKFCGAVCHEVMEPEYTMYQRSPHARVDCVQCHIGPGATWMVKSKINGIPQVFHVIKNSFSRPIPTPVENLRPARDTCEQCHWPTKFSGDILRMFTHYAEDENNTEAFKTNVYKVGGGDRSVARDIHWHITADVWYLPLDKERQEIAWVAVEEPNGNTTEFIDTAKFPEVNKDKIEKEKRLMDCVDCHNRSAHHFPSPAELIDEGLALGKIDKNIPFIKKKGVEVLSSSPGDIQGKVDNVEALRGFYEANYPEFFSNNKGQIHSAINQLKDFARLVEFPSMKLNWKTHIDNMGHLENPGCFRCHGKLIAQSGPEEGKPISFMCDDCHYSIATK